MDLEQWELPPKVRKGFACCFLDKKKKKKKKHYYVCLDFDRPAERGQTRPASPKA